MLHAAEGFSSGDARLAERKHYREFIKVIESSRLWMWGQAENEQQLFCVIIQGSNMTSSWIELWVTTLLSLSRRQNLVCFPALSRKFFMRNSGMFFCFSSFQECMPYQELRSIFVLLAPESCRRQSQIEAEPGETGNLTRDFIMKRKSFREMKTIARFFFVYLKHL